MEEYKYKWQIVIGACLLVLLTASLFLPRMSISGEDYVDMAVEVYEYAQEMDRAVAEGADAQKFLEDYSQGGGMRDSMIDSYDRMIAGKTGDHPQISGLYLGRCCLWEPELPGIMGLLIYLPALMAVCVLVFMLVKRRTYAVWLLISGVTAVVAELILYFAVPTLLWSNTRNSLTSLPLISKEILAIRGAGQKAVTELYHNCYSAAAWFVLVIGVLLVIAGILFLTLCRPKRVADSQSFTNVQMPEVSPSQTGMSLNQQLAGIGQIPAKGMLTGVQGQYKGQTIPLENGEEIVIGRDPAYSMLVFSNSSVSRRHCGIRYDAQTGNYRVIDYSSTGTRLGNGTMISASAYTTVPPGTVIYLGNGNERLLLG